MADVLGNNAEGSVTDFSDYIVFADESGDHGLETIDAEFPMFALVFCVFPKSSYVSELEPTLRRLKYDFFGHDAVVLHEREIRKQMKPFDVLRESKELRERFYVRVTELMSGAEMSIFATVIKKVSLTAKYKNPWDPYELAMHFCMEKVCAHLKALGQSGKRVHILFEARGKVEDQQLELEFRRIADNQKQWGWKKTDFSICTFEPLFVKKSANMAGHQISDLVARPIALKSLRPLQANRAFDVIQPKLGHLKTFP